MAGDVVLPYFVATSRFGSHLRGNTITHPISTWRPLAIQALGVFTSAGVRAATAFGSARLGLKFFEELPWNDAAGVPIVGGRTGLDLGEIAGDDRLATMAVHALRECASAPTSAARLAGEPPAPLLLCLPAYDSGQPPLPTAELLSVVAAEAGAPINLPASRAFASGRAAVFEALNEAARMLADRATPAVYLGGVDSLVDAGTLDRWLRAGRLKTSNTEGFIPGEGAAFLRLVRHGEPGALATVAGIGRARETHARAAGQPNIGAGLANAARAALASAGLPAGEVGAIIHDSGDRVSFREVSLAIARLRPRSEPPPLITTAAACAGELGAAYGPFAVGLAAFFLAHGVTHGAATLVLGSSEDTDRGAALVTQPGGPRTGRGAD